MTWEPSRKMLLVLRMGNRVEDRSDFLFSLIVFRRLHVKLCFFFSLLRCLTDLFSTFNDDMVFGAPGVSYCYSVVSCAYSYFRTNLSSTAFSKVNRVSRGGLVLDYLLIIPFAICLYLLLAFVLSELSYFPNLLYFC